ncbi:MAG: DUF1428 domain-containing protein [Hoeflea sp.]|uniref:DUF1428 domain-containing protein n=1 Tax=Hoeflea sp. TaxID=1940281 RepID=UPI0027302300|nr:DUF1428 domain-containing protein [Hoeflea sp.]MDP2121840.1 DUF1428 domain-containing protein [Hoeflea sp.]MDP3527527.1 DUF1428 domain-containing protein [Hoeflea sp.]
MSYVQGFLLAVPNANKAAYTDIARASAKVFRENGALSVMEAWGTDVPDGKVTSFPMAVKLEAEESVVFSWIIWPDKQAAETGMNASMKQLEGLMGNDMSKMPFDGMRMMWGGFEPIVEM